MAAGYLVPAVCVGGADELAELGTSLNRVVAAQRERAEAAAGIAGGDLSPQLAQVTQADLLGQSLQSIRESLRQLQQETIRPVDESPSSPQPSASGAFSDLLSTFHARLQAAQAPVREATRVLESLKAHDLTMRLPAPSPPAVDQECLGQTLNAALETLEAVFARIGHHTGLMLNISTQLKNDNEGMESRTLEQAIALRRLAQEVYHLVLPADASDATEATAAGEALQATAVAQTAGLRRLSELLQAVNTSLATVSAVFNNVEELSRKCRVLGVNAAIEAAHAGEAGRTFGAIAREMSSLSTSFANTTQADAKLLHDAVQQITIGTSVGAELIAQSVSTQERLASAGEWSKSWPGAFPNGRQGLRA